MSPGRLSARSYLESRVEVIVLGALSALVFFNSYQVVWFLLRKPYAADYRLYVTAARLALSGRGSQLYDFALSIRLQEQLRHYQPAVPFIASPAASVPFMPFIWLPYEVGYAIWILLSIAGLAFCWWTLAPRGSRTVRLVGLFSILGFLPTALLLEEAQIASAIPPLLALSILASRRSRGYLSGFWAGLAYLKPNGIFLFLPALLSMRGGRRPWLGAISAGALIVAVGVLIAGPAGFIAWLRVGLQASSGRLFSDNQLWTVSSLTGPVLLWPARGLLVLLLGVLCWRARGWRGELQLAGALLISGSLSPYLTISDMVPQVLGCWLIWSATAGWQSRALVALMWLTGWVEIIFPGLSIVLHCAGLAVLALARESWLGIRRLDQAVPAA